MWTIFFAITTVICAIGWMVWYVSSLSMTYYIEKKGYTQPSEEEMKECTLYVVRHLWK